jgi:hypothetical protein
VFESITDYFRSRGSFRRRPGEWDEFVSAKNFCFTVKFSTTSQPQRFLTLNIFLKLNTLWIGFGT